MVLQPQPESGAFGRTSVASVAALAPRPTEAETAPSSRRDGMPQVGARLARGPLPQDGPLDTQRRGGHARPAP